MTSSTLAIFRLHGRNAATWEKKGLASSSERFDYEYQKQELREFIAPVRQLAEQAEHVHVVFNNNLRDQGIRGATIFSRLLGLERGLSHTEGCARWSRRLLGNGAIRTLRVLQNECCERLVWT